MNAARRSIKRRDWPANLYETRPGYFVWRDPRTRQSFALGYIPLAAAKHEAMQANAHVAATKPSLLDRLTGATNTVAKLLEQMPASKSASTAKTMKSVDALIAAKLGSVACMDLTVAQCAEVVEAIAADGRMRWSQMVRARMMAMCQRGQQLGWMESNPASVTRKPEAPAKRGRLTLESFKAILAKAPEVSEWLPRAMLFAIVTAQDRSTIATMKRSQIHGTCLIVQRSKTKSHVKSQPVAIPLALKLDVIGVSLADLVAQRSGVVSPYMIHHVKPWRNAPVGSPIAVDSISHAFSQARELAGIKGAHPPTFHEIRSLALRLYKAQGNVDTKALAAHQQDSTHAIYQDPRGIEAIMVRVG